MARTSPSPTACTGCCRGSSVPGYQSGSPHDLVDDCCRLAARRDIPFFLLGAAPGFHRLRLALSWSVIRGSASLGRSRRVRTATTDETRDGESIRAGTLRALVAFGAPARIVLALNFGPWMCRWRWRGRNVRHLAGAIPRAQAGSSVSGSNGRGDWAGPGVFGGAICSRPAVPRAHGCSGASV